ncbi:hypothetical protein [Cellulomonas sp. P22]|uniref:hypothetical protein n=1 Tax=Cellulomonas sp. P22 TaxID=3373189 RepID=UPI0037BEEA14
MLGLLVIGLGIASATLWRADDILVASATPQDGTRLLVADPGVLELAGDPVTVTVEAPGDTPVVLAVGRDTDVAGWVGTDAYARVSGLSAWDTLSTEPVAATAPDAAAAPDATAPTDEAAPSDETATDGAAAAADAAAVLADPRGSDLWVAESSGEGSATLTWTAQPGRWSLLVASVGDEVPTLTMSWPRTVTTPWLVPALVVGLLLLAAGAVLGVRQWRRARRGEDGPEWHPVLTGAVPVVGAEPGASEAGLTRRQLRELRDAALAAPARRRERSTPEPADVTGAQPAVTAAEPSKGSRSWPTPSWAAARTAPDAASDPTDAAASRPAPAAPTSPSVPASPAPAAPAPSAGAPVPSAGRAEGRGPAWLRGRDDDVSTGRTAPVASGAPTASANEPAANEPVAAPAEGSRRRDVPTLGGRWVSRGPGRGEPAPVPAAPAVPAAAPGHADPHALPTRAELRRAATDGSHPAGPDTARPGAGAARPAWPHLADADAATSRADAWRRTWGIPGGEPLVDDTPPHPEESER